MTGLLHRDRGGPGALLQFYLLVLIVVGLVLPAVLGPLPLGAQTTDPSGDPADLCRDAGAAEQFADVEDRDYGAAYVLCMRILGLSAGRADGTYGPAAELTRGQMASFLVRLWRDVLGNECPSGVSSPFTDTAGNTHAVNIDCLFGLGITKGLTATTYGPDADLTASQISRFLFRVHRRATEAMNAGSGACSDGGSQDELERAVACLVGLRVVPTGAEAASSDTVTRAQMAVYVIGLWHNLAGRGLPPVPPPRPAPDETQPDSTTRLIAYARGAQYAWAPAWSPYGTRIAYGTYGGVWVMNHDGTNPQPLTFDHGRDPQWSPDGTRVVYSLPWSDFAGGGVRVVNADGTNQRELTKNGGEPEWSPDGARIAFQCGGICVVNADGTNRRKLTTDHGRSPHWSPDGTRLVYSLGWDDFADGGVRVVNADGTNRRKLTNDLGRDPQWSPDGTRIAYDCRGVCVVNADGTNRRQLTSDHGGNPQWSPDGTRILYSLRWSFADWEAGAWVVNADGTNPRKLTNGQGRRPQWSPDGTRITYANRGVWVMRADGTKQRKLTNEGIWVAGTGGPSKVYRQLTTYGWDPQWSPDATQIAFSMDDGIGVIDVDGKDQVRIVDQGWDPQWSPDGTRITYANRGVWVVNTDGSNPQQLTNDHGRNPQWSPDGTRVTYANNRGVWVVNADGSNPQQLTYGHGLNPQWSPDGTRITHHHNGGVWVVNADGTNSQQLTNDQGRNPQWSPDSTRIAYSNSDSRTGRDDGVWVVNADGTNRRKLTNERGGNPQWSPDGTQITFHDDYGHILVANVDPPYFLLFRDAGGWDPVWSPLGLPGS